MAARSTIKLAAVSPYLDKVKATAFVAGHYGEPVDLARVQVAEVELSARQAGF
jgi:hypothetical protein